MEFPVSLRNRLIGLELVLRHTEKLCLASYDIQFSTNIKMYNHKIKTSFLACDFGISGQKKLAFIL